MRILFLTLLGALALSATACDTSAPTDRDERAASESCKIGGCSAELCGDAGDGEELASDCAWLESYACYESALCERQAGGACGWTQTAELNACLASSQ